MMTATYTLTIHAANPLTGSFGAWTYKVNVTTPSPAFPECVTTRTRCVKRPPGLANDARLQAKARRIALRNHFAA